MPRAAEACMPRAAEASMPRAAEACILYASGGRGACPPYGFRRWPERKEGEEKRREERGEERREDERTGQDRTGEETLLAHWPNLVNMSIWQSGEMYQSGHAGRVAIRPIMQSGQSGILLNMANLADLSIW